MQPATLQAICRQVYARFPNLRDVKPTVQRQGISSNQNSQENYYLLVFKTSAVADNGRKMSFSVRVVADEHGKILKLTTSH